MGEVLSNVILGVSHIHIDRLKHKIHKQFDEEICLLFLVLFDSNTFSHLLRCLKGLFHNTVNPGIGFFNCTSIPFEEV